MSATEDNVLKQALEGDIKAFQRLFAGFQSPLKSYLHRLLASRSDADDVTHDTFIRAYDKLHLYRGESSLKTWVFQIATNLATNLLKTRKRWVSDVSEQAKELVSDDEKLSQSIERVAATSTAGSYDIREHISTCFSCITKVLPIENQVALLLKDVYDFSIKEIMQILGKTEGVVKYLLQSARKTMSGIFDRRCALVNKNGVCHQCSELNGWFNPKQNQQEALMKIQLVKEAKKYNKKELYAMRTALVKAIDPLRSEGNELQEILMKCNCIVMKEIDRYPV